MQICVIASSSHWQILQSSPWLQGDFCCLVLSCQWWATLTPQDPCSIAPFYWSEESFTLFRLHDPLCHAMLVSRTTILLFGYCISYSLLASAVWGRGQLQSNSSAPQYFHLGSVAAGGSEASRRSHVRKRPSTEGNMALLRHLGRIVRICRRGRGMGLSSTPIGGREAGQHPGWLALSREERAIYERAVKFIRGKARTYGKASSLMGTKGGLVQVPIRGLRVDATKCIAYSRLTLGDVERIARRLFGNKNFKFRRHKCTSGRRAHDQSFGTMACREPLWRYFTFLYWGGVKAMGFGATPLEAFAPLIHFHGVMLNLRACFPSKTSTHHASVQESYYALYQVYNARLLARLRSRNVSLFTRTRQLRAALPVLRKKEKELRKGMFEGTEETSLGHLHRLLPTQADLRLTFPNRTKMLGRQTSANFISFQPHSKEKAPAGNILESRTTRLGIGITQRECNSNQRGPRYRLRFLPGAVNKYQHWFVELLQTNPRIRIRSPVQYYPVNLSSSPIWSF